MTTSTLQDNKAVEHRVINKLFRRLIDLRQHDVARDPAQHVGDVKERRGQAKHRGGEAQIFAHRQPGKANVDAIEKREDKDLERTMTTSTLQDNKAVEHRVINKLFRRLIVFLFILFVFSFLDRINIGFADMVQVDAIPHTTMIPAIQRRAPIFASLMLLGIPHRT